MADRIKAILEAEDRSSAAFNINTAAIAAMGVAAVVASVKIGKQLASALKAAAQAAGVQEEAETLLAHALTTVGDSAASALPDLKAYASELQNLTGVGDEVILSNQRLLISIGRLTGDALKKATVASLDLAAATGVAQRTAFDLVAKAATGYTGTLSRYGILIDQSLPDNEKYAAALKLINEQFGGAAASRLDTYIGSQEELAGRIGDLQEAIGGPFKDVLTALNREVLSPLIQTTGDLIGKNAAFKTTVINLALAMVELFDIAERVTRTLRQLAQLIVTLKFNQLVAQVEFLTENIGALKAALAFLNIEMEANSLPAVDAFRERLKGLLKDGVDPVKDAVEGFSESLTVSEGKMFTAGQAIEQLLLGFDVAKKDIISLGQQIREDLGPFAIQTIKQLGDTIADSFFRGSISFKRFLSDVLQGLAKILARALIIQGIISAIGFIGGQGGGGGGLFGRIIGGLGGVLGAGVSPGLGGGISSAALPAPTGGSINIGLSLDPGVVVKDLNDAVERGSVTLTATRLKQVRNVR